MSKIMKGIITLLVVAGVAAITHASEFTIQGAPYTTFHLNNAALNMPGTVTVYGTVTVSSGTISVGGNWRGTNTYFSAGSGSVVFTGSGTTNQTLTGSSTFYNLTCTRAGNQLNFEAGQRQTIRNTLILNGASGNYLILRSTQSGSQWEIDPQGARSVNFVDVKDSNNVSSTAISPSNWTNSGNNTNWTSTGGGGDTGPTTPTLAITSKSPGDGATGVSVDAAVSATFSLLLNGSTVTTENFMLFNESSILVDGSVSVDGSTATFTPSENLLYGTTYTAVATTDIQAANAAGTTLASDESWSFTTESAPPTPTPAATATPTAAASPTPTVTVTPTSIVTPTATVTPEATPAATGSIAGIVTDASAGTPIFGATVTATGIAGTFSATTNPLGVYAISDMDEGTYIVEASAAGYDSDAVAGVTVTADTTTTLDFALAVSVPATPTPVLSPAPTPGAAAGVIVGTVTDKDSGNPIGGATVTVDGFEATTDSNGSFLISDIPAGDYTLQASADNYETATVEITVIEFPPATTITVELASVTCPDPTEADAATASVSPDSLELAKGESAEVVVTVTDDSGCPAEGVMVKRKLNKKNEKKINVTPSKAETGSNGQASFTIEAKKKKGTAKVKFKAKGVKEKPAVTVNLTK